MKFKIVGWANIILGGLVIVQQIIMLVFVYPKLSFLYQDFGTDLPWTTRNYPFVSIAIIALFAGVVFVGTKLAFNKTPKEGWFVAGLACLFVMLGLGGLFVASSMISIVGPIYDLTSQL